MKRLFFLCWLAAFSQVEAQSLADATRLFERYEYGAAASAYEQVSQKKPLNLEDYKRLAYCYYITGEYEKSFPVLDSLVRHKDMDAFFYYAHGNVCMSKGEYTRAKASYLNYKSLDNEFPVDVQVASCDSLLVWKPMEDVKSGARSGNISKADINGAPYEGGYLIFKEIGMDSLGKELPESEIDRSEIMLGRMYFVGSDGTEKRIAMPEELRFAAINSAAVLDMNGTLLVSFAEPLSEVTEKRGYHLYTCSIDRATNMLSQIQPWTYSGFEDTTFCTFPTANKSGNAVLFTKVGERTNSSDIYLSLLRGGSWSTPVPVNDLNTPYDEIAPLFSGDSLLTFSSDGRPGYGGLDLFSVKVGEDITLGKIEHFKAPVNSFRDDLNFGFVSDTVALFTSNRKGDKGDDDIYYVRYEKILPVVDTVDEDLNAFIDSWKDVRVYFEFAKYDVKDLDAFDTISMQLQRFGQCMIVIEGHTDARGDDEYNQHLGYFRADIIRQQLIKHGVPEKQIKVVSKGKTSPQVDCAKGCTEEEHKLNRVAIIKLEVQR